LSCTPTGSGTLTVPATTAAANEAPAQQGNNASSTTVPVNAAPPAAVADVVSAITCSPDPANAGTSVSCTVTCTNVGTVSAGNAFCTFPNAAGLPGSPSTAACPTAQSVAPNAQLSCGISFVAGATVVVQGGTGADN